MLYIQEPAVRTAVHHLIQGILFPAGLPGGHVVEGYELRVEEVGVFQRAWGCGVVALGHITKDVIPIIAGLGERE